MVAYRSAHAFMCCVKMALHKVEQVVAVWESFIHGWRWTVTLVVVSIMLAYRQRRLSSVELSSHTEAPICRDTSQRSLLLGTWIGRAPLWGVP